MEEWKNFKGILTRVKKVSDGFHRVDCRVREEGGKFVTNAYFIPVTPLLSPKPGMLVSFRACSAESLSRDFFKIGGVNPNV